MKITNTVRRLYDSQLEINERLQTRVKELFGGSKPEGWFYRGRIKPIESFAQKLETGRGDDPSALEDFFACTLVVENRNSIDDAIDLVRRFCTIQHQRPKVTGKTHKRPDSFQFDDLRLYVKLNSYGIDNPLSHITFEIQIKTFLQYAWGIATRDLIYKGDQIVWARMRVAFQVKAMLEHAEVSISEVDSLVKSRYIDLDDDDTVVRNKILKWLADDWDPDQLPEDRRRLVDNILNISLAMNIDIDDIIAAVETDTANGDGVKSLNLSPYGIIIRSLFRNRKSKVDNFISRDRVKQNLRIFLTSEMEIGELPAAAKPARYHRMD